MPDEVLRRVLDVADWSLHEARTFCLVSRAWLHPGRSLLFRDITVLAERVSVGRGFRLSDRRPQPDGREVTLYPRCMTAPSWISLVRRSPHLVSFLRVLKISNDEVVQFLNGAEHSDRFQAVRTLWLSNLFVDAAVDFHLVFAHFPSLHDLRMQNVRGVRVLSPGDILGKDGSAPVFVRFVGRVSPNLCRAIARSARARVVELCTFNLTSNVMLDADAMRLIQRHAPTLDALDIQVPYFFEILPGAQRLKSRARLNSRPGPSRCPGHLRVACADAPAMPCAFDAGDHPRDAARAGGSAHISRYGLPGV